MMNHYNLQECIRMAKECGQRDWPEGQQPQYKRLTDEEIDEILRELELELWAEEKIGGS